MKIIFTKSKNPVDWLIALMTGEDCGHMALLFEVRPGVGLVFESNLLGCHPAFFQTWMGSRRTIMHEMNITVTATEEDQIWNRIVNLFDGHKYDFGGAIYLGLCKLRRRLFNKPLPAKNRWAKQNRFFCDELYQVVSDLPGFVKIDGHSNGMMSPHDVYLKLSGSRI